MPNLYAKSISPVGSPIIVGRPHKFIIKGNGFKPEVSAFITDLSATAAVVSARYIDSATLEIEIVFGERDSNRQIGLQILNADGSQASIYMRVGKLEVTKIGPQ